MAPLLVSITETSFGLVLTALEVASGENTSQRALRSCCVPARPHVVLHMRRLGLGRR